MSQYKKDPALAEAIERRDESRSMVLRSRGKPNAPSPAPASQPASTPDHATVIIPKNWRDLPWIPKDGGPSIRSLASRLTDDPIRSKDDAIAAIEAELAKRKPEGEPVAIPEDWENLGDYVLIKLALEIVGGDGPLVPAEGQTEVEKAKAIINAEVEERTAPAA